MDRESWLRLELVSTREELATALRIGEGLQARVTAAVDELTAEERQLTDAELVAVLEGKS